MNFIEWVSQIQRMYDANATLATHINNWMNQKLANNFVLILETSLENFWIKFFSLKLALRTDLQILSLRKIISFGPRQPSITYMWPNMAGRNRKTAQLKKDETPLSTPKLDYSQEELGHSKVQLLFNQRLLCRFIEFNYKVFCFWFI